MKRNALPCCLAVRLALLVYACAPAPVAAADWPQYMRGPEHAGDAAAETLRLPLGLATCVKLDDAVTTSPAVVAGRIYVVDQMGTAYCIDPVANRIVWQTAPDGDRACGSNTSSPCVVKGRIYYGTTAGRLHILDAATGKVHKSIEVGWPVTGSPTAANDSIYFQHLGGLVHCLDLDGGERWRYEHYKSYKEPKSAKELARDSGGFPGSFHDPHYGGGEVAVAGKGVAVNLGWDLFCLDDEGKSAKLVWCQRSPLGKDAGIPMGPAIAGDYVYCGYPGTDEIGNVIRMKLANGSFDQKQDFKGHNWAVHVTPAVRDELVIWPRHWQGVMAYDFAANRQLWAAAGAQRRYSSCIASPVLTKEHCVFGTIYGELYAVAINATGSWPAMKPEPFKFATPFGKPIASAPVIADGAIYFGCDDGYLYGLAPDGKLPLPKEAPTLHEVRSKAVSATGKRYGAPVASMDQGNTNFADDPKLKPPLRLRWACRPFDLRVQMNADDDSIYFISEAGTLAALEQATGRVRWRRRLNGAVDGWKQMLLDGGRLYINRNGRPTAKPGDGASEFLAVDARTGATLWQQPWGSIQGTCRSSPVAVGKVVAGFTAEGLPPKPVARAFDAATGKPLWNHELPAGELPKGVAGGACVLDGVMFFSCGGTWGKASGSTIAVEPATGKILWTSTDYHVHGYGRPAARDGHLYLGGQSDAPMYCVSAKDGKLKWQADRISYSHNPALGEDYFVTRSYGASGLVRDLATGKPVIRDKRAVEGGCPDHACSPVLLTSGRLSYAVSSSGLYARDVDTGKIVWQSLGFAPRACTSPTAANGRLFFSPNVNNMLYCFEPVEPSK